MVLVLRCGTGERRGLSSAVPGGVLVAVFVDDGPYLTGTARFDPRAAIRVFSDRGTRLATLGYLGHMWELYSVWTWIAAFATASLGTGSGAVTTSTEGSALAFITIASGAAGSVAAGALADRVGQARIATWAMLASGACCALAGVLYAAPAAVLTVFVAVWGIAVIADSAQLSALVARYSPHDHVGTALTVQMCAGFLLTMASIRLVPLVAEAAGWRWTFLVLAPGPFLGALALRGLRDRT
jgi:MFS family permease